MKELQQWVHGDRSVRYEDYDIVPGWFYPLDAHLFHYYDQACAEAGNVGDLLEIGVYEGRTAVLLGHFIRANEDLVVCDLFGSVAISASNKRENIIQYSNLTRKSFEQHYRHFHDQLPIIYQCDSTELLSNASAWRQSFRFIHVDGSHLYDIVAKDIETSRSLVKGDAIVAFDDWSYVGVSAALWEAVANKGLIPLVLSPSKFYATWDHNWNSNLATGIFHDKVLASDFDIENQHVAGHKILFVRPRTTHSSRSRDLLLPWIPPRVVGLVSAIRARRRRSHWGRAK